MGRKAKILDKKYIYSHVNINPDLCWEWNGKVNKKTGYGQLGYKGKHFLAHRISYEIFKNEIPFSMTIDHLCKNRKCVNPFHLEIVTLKENILRGNSPSALNARKEFCKRGHPLFGNNVYFRKGRLERKCKICYRLRSKKFNSKRVVPSQQFLVTT